MYRLTSPATPYSRDLSELRQTHTLTCYSETFHALLLLQHAVFQMAGLYQLAYWHPL